jgi:PAS domain S-box-containing protein
LNHVRQLDASESAKWTGAILDVSDCLIVILDSQGRFRRLNRAGEALTGYTEQELYGRYFWEVVLFEEDAAAIREEFDTLLARAPIASPATRCTSRWKMRDGAARTFSWSSTIVRDAAGRVDYVVSSATEIAEGPTPSLSRELLEAQRAASENVSGYLHDTVSQNLVVLAFSLSEMQRHPEESLTEGLQNAVELVDRCCRDLRVLTYALAPPLFEGSESAAALEWYAEHLRADAGIAVEFSADAIPDDTAPEVRALLLAAIREWAERAIRHRGGRTKISLTAQFFVISLEFAGERADDEAVGGILSSRLIAERARALGGSIQAAQGEEGISARISVDSRGRRR